MGRLIDAEKGLISKIQLETGCNFITAQKIVDSRPTITEQEIAKPLFDEFKEKLSKWLYHNSESVCGDSMIDIYYLEGHIDEILYEMGIIGEIEDGSN